MSIIIPLVAAMIGAVIGASLAFIFQRKSEIRKEKRSILQVLMMYRNVGAHELDWIKALNAIDLVYHDNPSVITKYHTYLALTEPTVYKSGAHAQAFVELLYSMAQCTGYKNLTEDNIRLTYSPEGLALHYPHRVAGTSPSSVSSVSDSSNNEGKKTDPN